MEKAKKIKLFLGLLYFLIIITFLFLIFSKFSISDLTSYDFIKSNTEYLNKFKNSNLFLVSISFILFFNSLYKKDPMLPKPTIAILILFINLFV